MHPNKYTDGSGGTAAPLVVIAVCEFTWCSACHLGLSHKGGFDHKNMMWETEEKDGGKKDDKAVKLSFWGKFLLDDFIWVCQHFHGETEGSL